MGKLHHAPISIDSLLYGYTYKVAPCRQGRGVLCFLQSAAFLCLMDAFYPVDIMHVVWNNIYIKNWASSSLDTLSNLYLPMCN